MPRHARLAVRHLAIPIILCKQLLSPRFRYRRRACSGWTRALLNSHVNLYRRSCDPAAAAYQCAIPGSSQPHYLLRKSLVTPKSPLHSCMLCQILMRYLGNLRDSHRYLEGYTGHVQAYAGFELKLLIRIRTTTTARLDFKLIDNLTAATPRPL